MDKDVLVVIVACIAVVGLVRGAWEIWRQKRSWLIIQHDLREVQIWAEH